MTANDVFIKALALMDELETDGTVSSDTEDSYGGKAPSLIDGLQRDIAKLEGIEPNTIDALTDELRISDDSAARIAPYGLAARFVMHEDNDTLLAYLNGEFNRRMNTIKVTEESMIDDMNVMSGF